MLIQLQQPRRVPLITGGRGVLGTIIYSELDLGASGLRPESNQTGILLPARSRPGLSIAPGRSRGRAAQVPAGGTRTRGASVFRGVGLGRAGLGRPKTSRALEVSLREQGEVLQVSRPQPGTPLLSPGGTAHASVSASPDLTA